MTYKLKNLDKVLHHWPAITIFLNDADSELDAQVSSGDYFALLATRLDQVNQHLKDDHEDYATLEATIKELLYLQSKYQICKR